MTASSFTSRAASAHNLKPELCIMSRSSSGSWNGAADIVDLDRYMKGGVRPHITPRNPDSDCERLVVDCGGAGIRRGIADRRPSSSRTSVRRDKRYSHDSGLSDGSYARRKVHRRAADSVAFRAHREREREMRAAVSSNSMKTFRATCERALRDQQEQIARVAELCERLIQAPPPPPRDPAPVPSTRDSSDISSSSRSTRVRSRKDRDKRLTAECKTYKIIMNRLDDLNRLLACRARPPPQQPRSSSTGSVSVSDKIVGTETLGHKIGVRKCGIPVAYALTSSGYQGASAAESLKTPSSPRPPQPVLVERSTCSPTRQPKLASARAHSIDIAPTKPAKAPSSPPTQRRSGCLNVATESVIECDSNYSGSSAHAPHCQFDLDDPFHLYTQAKRLQTLHATTVRQRTHSVDTGRTITHNHSHQCNSHQSLCSRCLGYWRAITALASQFFGKTETQ